MLRESKRAHGNPKVLAGKAREEIAIAGSRLRFYAPGIDTNACWIATFVQAIQHATIVSDKKSKA